MRHDSLAHTHTHIHTRAHAHTHSLSLSHTHTHMTHSHATRLIGRYCVPCIQEWTQVNSICPVCRENVPSAQSPPGVCVSASLSICLCVSIYLCICPVYLENVPSMGWLRLVGSLKLQVSFAKEPYKRDYVLQKRPIILRRLLIVATPYLQVHFNTRQHTATHYTATHCNTLQHTATHCNTLQHSYLQERNSKGSQRAALCAQKTLLRAKMLCLLYTITTERTLTKIYLQL